MLTLDRTVLTSKQHNFRNSGSLKAFPKPRLLTIWDQNPSKTCKDTSAIETLRVTETMRYTWRPASVFRLPTISSTSVTTPIAPRRCVKPSSTIQRQTAVLGVVPTATRAELAFSAPPRTSFISPAIEYVRASPTRHLIRSPFFPLNLARH